MGFDLCADSVALMMALTVIGILRQWAKWGQGQSLGYPSGAAFFADRVQKSALFGSGDAPQDILEMERIVCMLEYTQRYLIIQRWQRHLSYRQLAKDLGVSTWRASRLLKDAESEVNRLYTSRACQPNTDAVYGGRLNNCL